MLTSRNSHRIGIYAATAVAGFALAATGCGSGSSSGSSTKTPTATSTTAAADLSTAKVDKVGTVVTNAKGFVLYRFDKDTAKPPASNCTGDCAALWPPAVATGSSVSIQGIDKSLVGTVTRADGTKQLTLAGWPLYTYAKDDEPREAYGQGVGGTWFAATPTGAKAQGGGDSSSSGGGY
ncbi:hypothetical protein [Streptomyces sp. NBC_01465]|uniref:hypothetical protein n=1 Tax=Streptomyces sp. NBC_01465 TaxID=2903878 RepID=UPI002E320CA8|nr:hypothetical protein [Streptomyces sp. NBC_01465]